MSVAPTLNTTKKPPVYPEFDIFFFWVPGDKFFDMAHQMPQSRQRIGAAEARWAHNPKVLRSKLRFAIYFDFCAKKPPETRVFLDFSVLPVAKVSNRSARVVCLHKKRRK